MTVELRTSEAKTIYMLNEIAVGDTFNIPFKYLDFDENIKVAIRGETDEDNRDTLTELTLDTDYYITSSDGTNGVWGVVTFQTEHSDLQSLVIYRDIPISQEKIFNSQTIFSTTTESALDKLTMIAQDNNYENRVLRAAIDDIVSEDEMILPPDTEGYLYTDDNGAIKVGSFDATSKAIRQPDTEEVNDTFVIDKASRRGKILAFTNTEDSNVDLIPRYTAGDRITIDANNSISAQGYTAGDRITITDNTISARGYTAGDGITIENDVISTSEPDYTAGEGITIDGDVISADPLKIRVVDATTWTGISLPSTAYWQSVCYGGGRFVAVASADSRKSAYSTDGLTWTEVAMPATDGWKSVCYGDGRFVAVAASSDKAAYSTDGGETWTEVTLPYSANWYSVCYGNGRFVAITQNSIDKAAYSTDGGETWLPASLSSAGYWTSVCYGGGKFVALAYFGAAHSIDGETWTEVSLPSTGTWVSLCYGDGKFVAVDHASNKAAYSKDGGATWTASTLPSANNWNAIGYGNGKFVAVADNNNNKVAYSYDGIIWYSATLSSSSTWYSICYGDYKFVAVANNSNKLTYTPNNASIYELI